MRSGYSQCAAEASDSRSVMRGLHAQSNPLFVEAEPDSLSQEVLLEDMSVQR